MRLGLGRERELRHILAGATHFMSIGLPTSSSSSSSHTVAHIPRRKRSLSLPATVLMPTASPPPPPPLSASAQPLALHTITATATATHVATATAAAAAAAATSSLSSDQAPTTMCARASLTPGQSALNSRRRGSSRHSKGAGVDAGIGTGGFSSFVPFFESVYPS